MKLTDQSLDARYLLLHVGLGLEAVKQGLCDVVPQPQLQSAQTTSGTVQT